MANFATANLTKYQAKISQMFQAGELRFRNPAVFNVFRRNTEIMIPSHNQIKNAAKITTGEVNFFNRSSRSLGTSGEVYNHTGSRGDSSVLIPSWTPYDDKFFYSLKQANGSVFELQDQIMAEMTNVFANFAEGLESASATYLNTHRTGVNAYNRQGSFNTSNDVFEITEDLSSGRSTGYRAAQIMKSAMSFNKYDGMSFTAICDTVMFDKMEYTASQGGSNSTNLSFQFSNVEWVKSPDLDALAVALGYTDGYCIVVPSGMIGVLDWIPVQNRQAIQTSVNKYGTLIDPNTGLTLATHSYEARANDIEDQNVKVENQIFTYLSFNHAPLTTADASPLFAFGYVPNTIV